MAVSIYRAISDILAGMIASIQQSGSALTDFSQGSVTRSFYEAVASELSLQSLVANQLRQDMFIATATGQALDDKASDFFVYRNPAVPATGTVRMIQATPGQTIFVPAGSVPLMTQATGVSNPSVTILTTADATLPQGTAYIDIPGQALTGGQLGNLAAGTLLIPGTPVNGILSVGGFQVTPGGSGFTGGVDQETDDAFRARIPIAVQGRVAGKAVSFEAATLGIPGIIGAAVVGAGQFDGSQVVVSPNVEVFYQGSTALGPAVVTACAGVTVLDQNVIVAAANLDRCVLTAIVTAFQGTDPVGLANAVILAAQTAVNSAGPGGTAYYSGVIQAIHNIPGVVSVNVPLGDFRRFTEPPGTVHDIVENPNTYPSLAATDCAVTVNLIPLP